MHVIRLSALRSASPSLRALSLPRSFSPSFVSFGGPTSGLYYSFALQSVLLFWAVPSSHLCGLQGLRTGVQHVLEPCIFCLYTGLFWLLRLLRCGLVPFLFLLHPAFIIFLTIHWIYEFSIYVEGFKGSHWFYNEGQNKHKETGIMATSDFYFSLGCFLYFLSFFLYLSPPRE